MVTLVTVAKEASLHLVGGCDDLSAYFYKPGPLECTFEPQLPQNCNGLSDGRHNFD